MTTLNPEVYRTAFVEYLRKGTPIHLSLKQARITDQYVWRTRRDKASGAGSLSYDFGAPYDFGDVAFSHGDGVVRGAFVGRVEDLGAMLRINGETNFEFSDIFEDPLNIGIEAGGTPYPITGNWTARFSAEVMKDAGKSEYGGDSGE